MDQHYSILGYLFLAYGALILLAAFLVGVVLSGAGALAGDPDAQGILALTGGTITVVLLVLALPYLLAGWGLLKRASWGRILAVVLAILALLSFPIGTALGIYALWALTRPEAAEAFA